MNLQVKLKNLRQGLRDVLTTKGSMNLQFAHLKEQLDKQDLLLGGLHADRVKHLGEIKSLEEAEFRVFSQFGQDGILQYIINHVAIPNKIFIEFGVQTYLEATTRFLLLNNRWKGLVMDGDKGYIDFINSGNQYWAYGLKAKHAFITRENINDLISEFTDEPDIGLLVIDIDGNDYYVWEALTVVQPRIIVCEYNSLFGDSRSLTVPYQPDFVNPDYVHYGASLQALKDMADKKGYALLGCNSAGNDAFFIRRDLLQAPLREVSVKDAYVQLFHGRPKHGANNAWKNSRPLFDVSTNEIIPPQR
jgi:hypothetical protein